MKKAFLLILQASLLTLTINARELTESNTTYNLKQTKGVHYTLPIHLNSSVEAQALLESGILLC